MKPVTEQEKMDRNAAKEYTRGVWVYYNQKRGRAELRPALRDAFEAGAKWERQRNAVHHVSQEK